MDTVSIIIRLEQLVADYLILHRNSIEEYELHINRLIQFIREHKISRTIVEKIINSIDYVDCDKNSKRILITLIYMN